MHALEKEMATHSSILAWRIPGTGEPGGLLSIGVTQSRTRLKRLSSSNILVSSVSMPPPPLHLAVVLFSSFFVCALVSFVLNW